jgi:hypothetical protein
MTEEKEQHNKNQVMKRDQKNETVKDRKTGQKIKHNYKKQELKF